MLNFDDVYTDFNEFKQRLETTNSIPQLSDDQEWVAKEVWIHQQRKIDTLFALLKVLKERESLVHNDIHPHNKRLLQRCRIPEQEAYFDYSEYVKYQKRDARQT